MSIIRFVADSSGQFTGSDINCRCAIGRGGVIDATAKQEGDGASPIGVWALERLYFRADRLMRPQTGLATIPLDPNDGWCDAPQHPLYNRPVKRPFAASHEALWRDDHVYDIIVELSHNANPVIAGRGSAIFFHLAHDDYRPTEGCIAVNQADMLKILSAATAESELEIRR